jgi:phosphatidylserine/phosphatidylglycerophosphate/cardiolipin synthase-like enzyme
MMQKYRHTISFLALATMSICSGMDQNKVPVTKTFLSFRENPFTAIESALEQGKFIFVDSYVFTNAKIAATLIAAQERGALVQINHGRHPSSRSVITDLESGQISCNKLPDLHMKRILISEYDPRTLCDEQVAQLGDTQVFDMSANLTYNAYRNGEIVVQTSHDQRYFMDHYRDHVAVTSYAQKTPPHSPIKQVLQATPAKRTVLNTSQWHLNASKALRIKKLLQSANKNRVLYISSMNWDNQDITDAVKQVHEDGVQVKVIINGTALKSGKDQLDTLHKAGVPIYVFDPHQKTWQSQHTKIILRIDGDESLLIQSTANLTAQGDHEINVDCYHPQDQALVDNIRLGFDQYIAHSCVAYGAITPKKEKKSVHKAVAKNRKKRLFADISNQRQVECAQEDSEAMVVDSDEPSAKRSKK